MEKHLYDQTILYRKYLHRSSANPLFMYLTCFKVAVLHITIKLNNLVYSVMYCSSKNKRTTYNRFCICVFNTEEWYHLINDYI